MIYELNSLGSFCQGYSPGSDDLCMTVPLGCYIVASGYNVMPALTCTAPPNSSTAAVTSKILIPSGNSSSLSSTLGTFSPSAAPLSSRSAIFVAQTAISSQSSLLTSNLSPSPAPPPSGTVLSGLGPSIVSSSGIMATPASSKADGPSASSNATQSSALPVALVNAVGKVTNAQSLGETLNENPTAEAQTAVEQAVDDAQNGKTLQHQKRAKLMSAYTAVQRVKDAINPQSPNFQYLSSKLDELLQDLTEVTETLAETEALADVAAAIAPELAAAAAAAAAAELLERVDNTKPTNQAAVSEPSISQSSITRSFISQASISQASTYQSSTSQLSMSQPSVFQSPASVSQSSINASIPSSSSSEMLSTSSASSASSSDSSQSSGCPCVSCADTALPVDEPTENDEGIIDVPGGGTNETVSPRYLNARDLSLFRRAQTTKQVRMCRKVFNSRPYTTGSRGNNFRSYGYLTSTASCKWTFSFVTGDAGQTPARTQSNSYQSMFPINIQMVSLK